MPSSPKQPSSNHLTAVTPSPPSKNPLSAEAPVKSSEAFKDKIRRRVLDNIKKNFEENEEKRVKFINGNYAGKLAELIGVKEDEIKHLIGKYPEDDYNSSMVDIIDLLDEFPGDARAGLKIALSAALEHALASDNRELAANAIIVSLEGSSRVEVGRAEAKYSVSLGKASEFLRKEWGDKIEAGEIYDRELARRDPALFSALNEEFAGRKKELRMLLPSKAEALTRELERFHGGPVEPAERPAIAAQLRNAKYAARKLKR